ncbi:hypothetical protein ACIQNG_16650 [Streptomyces sp. NPDC091377]|uniref:hypothetical protein n=1 Tax=unclassified Streptomyces TaxID=2593676 RepID=UPI00382915EA
MIQLLRDPFPTIYPAVALDGCGYCAELKARQDAARAEQDDSALVDANVLLRRHVRLEHRP